MQASAAARSRPSRLGAKQSRAEIDQLKAMLLKHIAKHSGERVEQINKHLETQTNEVRRPLAQFAEGGELKIKGRRATRYYRA